MIKPSIVEAKFLRANVKAKKTFIWRDADEEWQEKVLREFPLLNVDDIIIAYKGDAEILLLKKDGIITKHNYHIEYSPYLEIKKVIPYQIDEELFNKNEVHTLSLILKNEQQIAIPVEPICWHVIFSIIKWIIKYHAKSI